MWPSKVVSTRPLSRSHFRSRCARRRLSCLTFVEILIPISFSTKLATGLDGDEEPCSSPGSHPPGVRRRSQGSSSTSSSELALDGAEGPWHPWRAAAGHPRRGLKWDESLKERGPRQLVILRNASVCEPFAPKVPDSLNCPKVSTPPAFSSQTMSSVAEIAMEVVHRRPCVHLRTSTPCGSRPRRSSGWILGR